jgi:hypothetical protein
MSHRPLELNEHNRHSFFARDVRRQPLLISELL